MICWMNHSYGEFSFHANLSILNFFVFHLKCMYMTSIGGVWKILKLLQSTNQNQEFQESYHDSF